MSTPSRPASVAPTGPAPLLRRLQRWKAGTAVLVQIDVRHMRSINRLSDADCGDRLLQQVLEVMRGWAGRSGLAERLWSNEFVAAKPIDHAQAAADEAADLRDRLAVLSYTSIMGESRIAIALGLTLAGARPVDWKRSLAEAGDACLTAKRRGLNQIVRYTAESTDPGGDAVSATRVASFRRLLAERRLQLHPQPIMDIRGPEPRLRKAEFLIRAVEDGRVAGLPPGTIESLEYFGLATELDAFSADALFDWIQQNGTMLEQLDGVSINLSGRSIQDGAFMDGLLRDVRTLRPPYGKVCFEITESAAIANLELAAEVIQAFRAEGCRFSLDDFGSGVCSFGYLQTLPVDEVKIDGRFVQDITSNPVSAEIIRAIHQVARATGKRTVAEFVDNARKLTVLRSIGVDYAQGWLFHPAVSPGRFEVLLRDEQEAAVTSPETLF